MKNKYHILANIDHVTQSTIKKKYLTVIRVYRIFQYYMCHDE